MSNHTLFLSVVATTAAGVAVGSAVGHTLVSKERQKKKKKKKKKNLILTHLYDILG
jgi:hypothetical protein